MWFVFSLCDLNLHIFCLTQKHLVIAIFLKFVCLCIGIFRCIYLYIYIFMLPFLQTWKRETRATGHSGNHSSSSVYRNVNIKVNLSISAPFAIDRYLEVTIKWQLWSLIFDSVMDKVKLYICTWYFEEILIIIIVLLNSLFSKFKLSSGCILLHLLKTFPLVPLMFYMQLVFVHMI